MIYSPMGRMNVPKVYYLYKNIDIERFITKIGEFSQIENQF